LLWCKAKSWNVFVSAWWFIYCEAYPHRLVGGLNEDAIEPFLISYVPWVLADIITESSCCFWKCLPTKIIVFLSTPTVGSCWWSQWESM
jgi:hypothetical protein